MRYAFFFLFLLCSRALLAQAGWQPLATDLLASLADTAYAEDPLNRGVGALAVMPRSGDLFLVVNGEQAVYRSRNQGKTWRPTQARTHGRAYGSFSLDVDYATERLAVFMIVQEKGLPAAGAILSRKGNPLGQIGKPGPAHDGWTWGMVAWEQAHPAVILGKEHHAWTALWKSTDGGQTWQKLEFESRNPGLIDAQTFLAGNKDGIYRSVDQGESWDKVSDFVVSGKHPIRYADRWYWTTDSGVVVSADQGASWDLLGAPLPQAMWGPYFGRSEQELMVVTPSGFFASQNGGAHWHKLADFFAPPRSNRDGQYDWMHPTNSYGWDPARKLLYAAGLGGGVWRLEVEMRGER